jgi:hypothetical protein
VLTCITASGRFSTRPVSREYRCRTDALLKFSPSDANTDVLGCHRQDLTHVKMFKSMGLVVYLQVFHDHDAPIASNGSTTNIPPDLRGTIFKAPHTVATIPPCDGSRVLQTLEDLNDIFQAELYTVRGNARTSGQEHCIATCWK